MKRKKRLDKSVYRALALVTQFGVNMLVPICMLTALGVFLDNKFETSWWTILLFFVGALSGGQSIYRMAKRICEEPSERDRQRERDNRNADNRDVKKDK